MFKFKLEALRQYRKRKEEKFQRSLHDVDNDLNQNYKVLDQMTVTRQSAFQATRYIRNTRFTPSDTLLFEPYLKRLNNQIAMQDITIKEKEKNRKELSDKLLSAVKKRKMVDKIKEYRLIQYRKEKNRSEQKESDEMAVLRYNKPQIDRPYQHR